MGLTRQPCGRMRYPDRVPGNRRRPMLPEISSPAPRGYRGAGKLVCRKCRRVAGLDQPPPLAAWISRTLTLRAQLTGFRLAPGTGLQLAGGGPLSIPTAQQACQVSVAVMFQVPGWRKVTPQSAVPLAPVWATLPGLLTISLEPRYPQPAVSRRAELSLVDS